MHRTTTPKWRVPPPRTGPIEAAGDDPAWLDALWNWSAWGCAIMAIATLAIGIGTWLASQ